MALSKEEMGVPHPDLNALAAFIDGRPADAERAVVAAHLAGCLECRTVLATYARGQMPLAAHAGERAGLRSGSRFRPAVWLPIAATLALTTTAALLWRIDRASPPPSSAVPAGPQPPRPDVETPVPVAPRGDVPAQPPGSPSSAVAPAPTTKTDPLATRRGAVRVINGKTFRLVAGEWIDSAYDPVDVLPVRDIVGSDARTALTSSTPELAPYAALGPKVTVRHEGVVYRFRP